MKVTPWYPKKIKPVRSGKYQVQRRDGETRMLFWSQKFKWWMVEVAPNLGPPYYIRSSYPVWKWRGVEK